MTNADAIRNMTNDELDTFIRTIYLCGKNGDGLSFCDYNLELWLEKDYKHCSTCKFEDAPCDESSPCYKCATEDSMWQAKTESCSEKLNNCETCRNKGFEGCEQPCLGCGCCGLYEPKDEPQTEREDE